YYRLQDWEKVIDIYEKTPWKKSSIGIASILAKVVEAYCQSHQFQKALHTLSELEAYPYQKDNHELFKARNSINTYISNQGGLLKLPSIDLQNYQNFLIAQEKKEIKRCLVDEDVVSHLKFCWGTWLLILLNIVMFAIIDIKGKDKLSTWLYLGANNPEFVFIGQEYWRLVTCLFLHGDYGHLIINLLSLYFLGIFTENFYGRFRFFILYFATGILSSLISIFSHIYVFGMQIFFQPIMIFSIGASSAICGLLGINIYTFWYHKSYFTPAFRQYYLFSFIFIVVTMPVLKWFIPQIDNTAHFSGLIVGIVCAALCSYFDKVKLKTPVRFFITKCLCYLGMMMTMLAIFMSIFYFSTYVWQGGFPYVLPQGEYEAKKMFIHLGKLLPLPYSFSIPTSWRFFDPRSIDNRNTFFNALLAYIGLFSNPNAVYFYNLYSRDKRGIEQIYGWTENLEKQENITIQIISNLTQHILVSLTQEYKQISSFIPRYICYLVPFSLKVGNV
ncbi:MAG: rhomboid family intramembrane serine protease, partial [Candidatus Calescibacterium sp.]|nr:rhomboid family intramembrane serine protease [Candidatus Calescibacterium sp.]